MKGETVIVLDLDGTLLDSNKALSPGNYQALEQAAQRGCLIVPCTGRFFGGMPEAVRNLPFLRYAITINGARVTDLKSKETIYSGDISPQRSGEVFSFLDTQPVIYDCYQDEWGWMERRMKEAAGQYVSSPAMLDMIARLRTPVEDLPGVICSRNRGVQKIQAFLSDQKKRKELLALLPERFPDLAVTTSVPENVEINSRLAQKGLALEALCRKLGVPMEKTIAFGDGMNDVTMLHVAGIGVAMGNGEKEIREMADYVTDTNDNDGVAAALRHFGII